MSVVTWPSCFPNPNTGVSSSVGESVRIMKMDSGEYRQRRDRVGRGESHQVFLTLESFRAAIFISWFKHKLGGGATPFSVPLPRGQSGGGLTLTTVRVTSPEIKFTLAALPFLWSASFSVETDSTLEVLGAVDPLDELVEVILPALF